MKNQCFRCKKYKEVSGKVINKKAVFICKSCYRNTKVSNPYKDFFKELFGDFKK